MGKLNFFVLFCARFCQFYFNIFPNFSRLLISHSHRNRPKFTGAREGDAPTQFLLGMKCIKLYSGHATYEENNLLKRELERLKIESNTINSSTNDQLIKLRNEIEELKIKLKLETDARKAAQKLAKELQLKNDKLRLRGAKKGKFDGKELEEIQVSYQGGPPHFKFHEIFAPTKFSETISSGST